MFKTINAPSTNRIKLEYNGALIGCKIHLVKNQNMSMVHSGFELKINKFAHSCQRLSMYPICPTLINSVYFLFHFSKCIRLIKFRRKKLHLLNLLDNNSTILVQLFLHLAVHFALMFSLKAKTPPFKMPNKQYLS